MDQSSAVDAPIQLVLHDDEDAPREFVLDLFRTVFGQPEKDAIALTWLIHTEDKVVCGPYPPAVAHALLQAAQERMRASGHELLITTATATSAKGTCDL